VPLQQRLDLDLAPNGMPQLSRGKHRSAKTGACFMEFASYLAGEPWSDSPQCTDPLLAHLARGVNDQLADSRRAEIAPEIPRVIGLRGDHRILAPVIALRAAAVALPVASAARQNALALSLISLPALIPSHLAPSAREAARSALDAVPFAARRARDRAPKMRLRERDLVRTGCAAAVQLAITGIAEAALTEADDANTLLIGLLRDAITDVEDVVSAPEQSPLAAPLGARSVAFA
jgi:hypothetical protein